MAKIEGASYTWNIQNILPNDLCIYKIIKMMAANSHTTITVGSIYSFLNQFGAMTVISVKTTTTAITDVMIAVVSVPF